MANLMNFALLNILQRKQIWTLPLSAINPSTAVPGKRLEILFIYLSIFPLIKYSWLLLITRNYCNLFVPFSPALLVLITKAQANRGLIPSLEALCKYSIMQKACNCTKRMAVRSQWRKLILLRLGHYGESRVGRLYKCCFVQKVELPCLTVSPPHWRRPKQ